MFAHNDTTLEGKALSQQTSTKVSAQTRERTLRIAVVPLSSRPTLHWRVQQSELEQDCRKKEEGVGKTLNMLRLITAVILKILLMGTQNNCKWKSSRTNGEDK